MSVGFFVAQAALLATDNVNNQPTKPSTACTSDAHYSSHLCRNTCCVFSYWQLSFYSRSTCVEYIAEFRSFLAPLLTDNFLVGVAMLPSAYPSDEDLTEAAWNERAIFAAFIAEVSSSYTPSTSNTPRGPQSSESNQP